MYDKQVVLDILKSDTRRNPENYQCVLSQLQVLRISQIHRMVMEKLDGICMLIIAIGEKPQEY